MNPARRAWLGALAMGALGDEPAAAMAPAPGAAIRRGTVLAFPRDHGAHLDARTEWWYVTGWLAPLAEVPGAAPPTSTHPTPPTHGFQVTFFRSRVQAADAAVAQQPGAVPGRFAPRHLLFAHAAITDLGAGRHFHAQRIARWNGDPGSGPDRAALADAQIRLGRWRLWREDATADAYAVAQADAPADANSARPPSRWQAEVPAEAFALRATLRATQAPILQGDAGFSRKGPDESQASLYYSQAQLDTALSLELNGRSLALRGRAWLDHEWSEEMLHPQAVGWDWIGINLFDGGALTAFQLRRADGSGLWAGGSYRRGDAAAASAPPRSFTPTEVMFNPGRRWRSAATNAAYPMSWQVRTPAGTHTIRSLLDTQELDSRGSTGGVYWEGLAECLDEGGRRIGLGYLEMTGYAAPIKLG